MKEEANINYYFLCNFKKQKEFIGFNGEKLNIEVSEINNEFENSFVYCFKNLKKKGDELFFSKNISTFEKSNGIILSDKNINFNKFEPFSLIGKIIQVENNRVYLLTPFFNKIIIISKIEQMLGNKHDYQYIYIYYIRFDSKEESIIYFTSTNFTSIKILKDNLIDINRINTKICFKFNVLDFEEDLEDLIQIKNIGIELDTKEIKVIDINKKIIYFFYEKIEDDYEYFPQKIYLNSVYDDFPYKLQFFAYKGFLNEVNLFIRNKFYLAYEFLFFSLDNKLPDETQILYKPGKKLTTKKFHSFGCETRKSIIFINIPPQDDIDLGYDTSFLYIYLCNKDGEKLYAKFCLNSIEVKSKIDYQFNPIVKTLIYEIYDHFSNNMDIQVLQKKYFSFNKNINDLFKSEMNKKFHLFNYPNRLYTLNYFNALCLWNLYKYLKENGGNMNCISEYIQLYKNISKRTNELNYIDMSMILVSFVHRIFEIKSNFKSPKIFFYNELENDNPYKIAYDFQYQIIENLKEQSCLFLPLLFLDSYAMNVIYYNNFSYTKGFLPAYSLSMLPIESIKNNLKKIIKNYFFVLDKGEKNERKYYSSMHKYNFLVTYNENILLKNSKFQNIYNLGSFDKLKDKKNFAFIINLENLHEKFSYNKEELINTKKSPTLFFDINFKLANVYHYDINEYGEAGTLLEGFIAKENLIKEMKKTQYEMGIFLEAKYYVSKNFNDLIEGFRKIYIDQNKKDFDFEESKQLSNNENSINDNISKGINNEEQQKEVLAKVNSDEIKDKKEIMDNILDVNDQNDNKNEIYLSRHNTYILKADTIEELMEKVENMKKKKIIRSEEAVENNTINTNY